MILITISDSKLSMAERRNLRCSNLKLGLTEIPIRELQTIALGHPQLEAAYKTIH